ncbi:nucleotidyl transferase AbiEii/AbiGii toxin family protein [Pseudomethylobacillus aquaticus]|uniref:Nucleotidyl transferase AbiEii/AbiGii toxin family protein n=1 Tax=Pseudomethylobacillus aquaticus TaxID=2676064 RepID=A0A3N0UXY1_9PROT|nr:nucleotidyl transferase AbiEii/AbiGii toxin family protein [Pseudomethylobacillus aquaticus]ROH85419.1 nucleotidyl transferase AbiEii/AbiGii toxin family protein [Pseudomethylobacillus aquaticus]
MLQLTKRDILEHQQAVPWPNLRQVEQDLLLCQTMILLFNDAFLQEQIAMRGGTLLHKVHLAPASRYSEDIDLVIVGDRPDDHISKAIRRVLATTLGKPTFSAWQDIKLAIRNAVKPSKVLRKIYHISSIADPGGKPLEIVLEVNATERTPYQPIAQLPFALQLRNQTQQTTVRGFDIHEMLGTKMRALFQRTRGRDLFDLYWALTQSPVPVSPTKIIDAFQHYMRQEQSQTGRADFIEAMQHKLADKGFLTDMNPLLRTALSYDPKTAGEYVTEHLLMLIPE